MLLAFLACGAFFPAKAENGYFVQGYVKTDGEVLNERPADITPMIEWDSRIELSGNPINGATFFGWNVKNEDYKSKVSSIHAFLEIKKDNATYLAKTQFKDANANASDWGQINTNNMEPGNYTNILYLEVTWTDNTTSTYEFGPFNYTIKDSTEPKQPTLSISDPSYTYKDASTVTASIKVNYENPDNVTIQGIRVGAVGAPGEAVAGKEYRHDWNKTDDGTGDIVWGDIMLPANWATGEKTVSFDLVNLPENNATINAYFKAYIIPAEGANIEAAQQHLVVSTVNNTQTEPGMVNTVYSESYNVAPYTNGISYTAANFNEDGSVKWTFPSWAKEYTEDGETVTAKNGISGRWVKIEKSAVENAEFYAPKITYTLSNDVDGYMYFSMTIHSENIPAGLKPEFWVNNNRNQEDVNMTVVEGTNNKQWTWKSHYQYPNNHIISYQLYLSSSVGNAVTRVFGYEVRGATNGRVKQPANVELEKIAENAEIYQGKNISAQIYFLQAYDAYSAPQDDFKDKPIPMGTWSYTRCPSDFSNLNTEAFHFSPEIIYFVSNAVEDNQENKTSKLYFSFQLGKSYGIVDGEERELSTIIPNDYVPQLIVYVPKENTTATTNAGLRANETVWVENEVTNMSQVRNYLNTYEVTSAKEYAANSNIKVGIKHTFTSIMGGKGYSVMEPRGYKMSSEDEVITGIEEVASEAEAVPAVATVYNLQGMAVRVNVATENALEGLPAGIYIVNGKKYAVR